MARIVTLVAALAGAVALLVGIMQARADATSEGAAGATALVVLGAVLLVGAAVALLLQRRRTG